MNKVSEEESEPIIDSILNVDSVPSYLINQSSFFISSKNRQYLSFEIAIKKITLVDFNGDVENVVEYKNPVVVDLASMYEKRLLVFNRSVFASEYERLVISFDVKGMRVKKLASDQTLKTMTIHNFIDFDFSSDDLVMEVGINKDSGVIVRSDQVLQFDIQFDLDKSLKKIGENDAEIFIFRPSVKVDVSTKLPDTFFVKSKGFRVKGDRLSIDTVNTKHLSNYRLDNILIDKETFIAMDGIKKTRDDLIALDLSSSVFSIIDAEEDNKLSARALFITTNSVSALPVFNEGNDSSMFIWLENSRDKQAESTVTVSNIIPLIPSFYDSRLHFNLAKGQAGQVIKNDNIEGNESTMILHPLSVSGRVTDKIQQDDKWLYTLEARGNQLFASDSVEPESFKALIESDVRQIEIGDDIRFYSYLVKNDIWNFYVKQFQRLNSDSVPLVLTKNEFDNQPLIEKINLSEDGLEIKLNENMNQSSSSISQEGFDTLMVTASTDHLELTYFTNNHSVSKQYLSHKEYYNDYNKLVGSGALSNTIKATINKKSKSVEALEVVFYFNPSFYDILAHLNGLPLAFYPSNFFDNTDLSYVDFQVDSAFLNQLFGVWSDAIVYSDDQDNFVCDPEKIQEVRLAYRYCKYIRLVRESRRLMSENARPKLFIEPINVRKVRDAYTALLANLPDVERDLLNYHLRGDYGYYPKRFPETTGIKRAEKIIKGLKKVYKTFTFLFPDLTLKRLVNTAEGDTTQTPVPRKKYR